MKKIYYFFFFSLFPFFIINAQETFQFETIVNKYYEYNKLIPETIFTQVNKNIYFKNEELWFKTYIYNTKSQLPYLATKNIYVGIYDSKGNLITKKLFYAKDGSTYGSFEIDDSFKSGIYFLKTTTNWMRNFNEDRSHIVRFEVIESSDTQYFADNSKIDYDFQILPEGGHLVNEVINSVGFKITDSNGKGSPFISGRVLDNENNQVTSFKSNAYGIGKFTIYPERFKNYKIEAYLENNRLVSTPLAEASPVGIVITVDNITNNSNLLIKISTNKESISELLDKEYSMAITRDGLFKKIDVSFNSNQLEYIYKIDRKNLFPGINILTVFDHRGNPVLERIIFNRNDIKIKDLNATVIRSEKDSTVIKINTSSLDKATENLSVSVLPKETKAYTTNSNILSAFLLRPYLKGNIENPEYYFKSSERNILYDLDLLLLTQGWSKYNWKNIFYRPQIPIYEFETGFKIKGKLNNHKYKNTEKIVLMSKSNGIYLENKLEKDNSFLFDSLFLTDSTDIVLSLINSKDKNVQAYIYHAMSPILQKDSLIIGPELIDNLNYYTYKNKTVDIFYEDAILLDTVSINKSLKPKAPKNNPSRNVFGAKYFDFSETLNSESMYLTEVIRNNGFDIVYSGFGGFEVSVVSRRGNGSPIIFINNVDISNTNSTVLSNIRVADVEEMFISSAPANTYGGKGRGGVIYIFTKQNYRNRKARAYNSHKTAFGFSEQKKYYSPVYNKSQESFSDYGVLNWIPNIQTDKKGELTFKIPNYSNTVNLYIEGMSLNGALFSKLEIIKTN